MNRRKFISQTVICAGGFTLGFTAGSIDSKVVLKGVREFLNNVANKDGSFRPGVDPDYKGTSDTGLSGIAAPAYATILFSTFGWSLPYPDKTREFFISCQKPDGACYAPTGSMDQNSPQAKLYNTLQSLIALRLLGAELKYDPLPVVEYFFKSFEFKKLPLYTTSFFPLFYSALGMKMPDYIHNRMRDYLISEQKEDGYLGNHVASTFHSAHYFRLVGQPTPKAKEMVNRVISDQKNDGSWHLFPPSWDVHACFDALFILRQLGDPNDPRLKNAYKKATNWLLQCRKPDGGFSHFPDVNVSDVDAVYFQVGGLIQTGYLKMKRNLKHEEILGWGHVMNPEKTYSCLK